MHAHGKKGTTKETGIEWPSDPELNQNLSEYGIRHKRELFQKLESIGTAMRQRRLWSCMVA